MPPPNGQHLPSEFGFRSGRTGTHNTRSIMLQDLEVVLKTLSPEASKEDYREAVVDQNLLGKRTASSRKYGFQRLAELYALDPTVPVFRLLRHLWGIDDGSGRAVLAMLCALARDPILRATAPAVLDLEPGASFAKDNMEQRVEASWQGRFSPTSLAKIARMAGSSWTQSGHLQGRYQKVRTKPDVTMAAAAYAIALGYLAGVRGEPLLSTFWVRALDVSRSGLRDIARQAARHRMLVYRNAGGIIEIDPSPILTHSELESINEPSR